ncbi:MAG: T9SS C-terminal target domain-containing protein, partial [Rhodothermus sp.]|nr:T9SS C-terminal target domain-containing protein [Rhodothermus sp.]
MQYRRRSLWALCWGLLILSGSGILIAPFWKLQASEEVVVTLPIEVIGPDSFVVAVEVFVSDTTGVDSLYLKAHNLGYKYTPELDGTGDYDKKASFRINGGAWIPIDNAHFKAFYPESKMYAPPLTGPIGGPYQTLRGMISIRGTGKLRPGRNTIEFRFNGTEGISSGYRVLELDLRRGGRNGQSVLQGTRFVWDDPAQWGPPEGYDTPEAIAEGQRLWKSRHLLRDASGQPLVAACADCHAESGFDLKYFNFSNRSIIVRAQFHGLSEDEGKKIAAYIRSIDLKLPPGETVASCGGRPWDPPYQPGPGLSKR